MAIHSLDTAKKFSSEILPLVFLAMHAKPKEDEDGKRGVEFSSMLLAEFKGQFSKRGWGFQHCSQSSKVSF